MKKKRKVTFKLPETIKHEETRKLMGALLRQLNEKEMITQADIPQLHRMATAYDMYLTCTEVIAREGATMKNIKGEIVKRPEANLQRESWSQYLELAKEYGLTAKSKGQLKQSGDEEGDSPLDEYLKGRMCR